MNPELLQEYEFTAMHRRGHIIGQTIRVERMIDYYIASHFCKQEQLKQELMTLVISTKRMGFEDKRQVFKALVEKHDKGFPERYPKIFSDLKKVMEQRNIFAHYALDTTTKAMDEFQRTGDITFINYTNPIEWVKYSRDKTQKYANMIFDCAMAINDLNKKKAKR